MTAENSTRRAFFGRLAAGGSLLMPGGGTEVHYRSHRDGIEVFGQRAGRRWSMQRVRSANPSFLALDAARSRLFAVNEIDEYQGLPAGSVESYAVEAGSGRLALLSRQRLALSAIGPKSLAISPDGRFLVVAVYGGGSYNVLPVNAGGTIGPVTQALKEIGRGPHPRQASAHPHSVAFHPSGRFVMASDFGRDRIRLFSFASGGLSRLQQIAVPGGSGPADLRLSVDGGQVVVEHRLQPLRSYYRFDERNGLRLQRMERLG